MLLRHPFRRHRCASVSALRPHIRGGVDATMLMALGAAALVLCPLALWLLDDPLSGLPPANAGAFEGGRTGTLADAGANNAVPENQLRTEGGIDVPTGGKPSPLFGAQPFVQQLLLFEELGTRPLPPVFTPGNPLPQPPNAQSSPDSQA